MSHLCWEMSVTRLTGNNIFYDDGPIWYAIIVRPIEDNIYWPLVS